MGARIIAVVDAWDAMTTDRPYRGSLETSEAERRLGRGSGLQWDERIVEVFLDLHARGDLIPMDGLAGQPAVE